MPSADELALFGGTPVISQAFPPYSSIGEEEAQVAGDVVRSGCLSGYIGADGPGFMGGPQVRALEEEAAEYFEVRHCLATNSWTTGLQCAVGALGLEAGDEVITSPWTMAATATSILHWNAVPVFADIDATSFNLDPSSVEARITARTRAILAPDIFGQSANIEALTKLCTKHNLSLISDTAQAPGATRNGKFAGTLARIGGFSLNRHKHITCGEGGLLVTNEDELASRVALLRNHGEVLIGQGYKLEINRGILGSNYRLGEMEAAVARVQLRKLPVKIASRQEAAERLTTGLRELVGLSIPDTQFENTNVYYVLPLLLDDQLADSRGMVAEALRAEGVTGLLEGYQNIHRLPVFKDWEAYGLRAVRDPDAERVPGDCPTAEALHSRNFLGLQLCAHEFSPNETDLVVRAFRKVWSALLNHVG